MKTWLNGVTKHGNQEIVTSAPRFFEGRGVRGHPPHPVARARAYEHPGPRLSKKGDTPEAKRGAPGSRAWLLISRSRDSSSVLQPCFAKVLAYLRFDDLLASLRVNNWPRAPQQEHERSASVKGFGRRPIVTVGGGTGAVVGKPPGKEPAGS